jgi:pimeloyl-ACP methyl ester carboxylesterase
MSSDEVEPFELHVEQAVLDDLKRRLEFVRWPDGETVEGWGQGVPIAQAQRLRDYWLNRYDWRRCEAELNGFGQFRTELDGLKFHFLHVRSPNPDALPLVLTHGWPGSVLEFAKVIRPLTDPAAHGDDAADAFHLVIPSLPGYGFSERPRQSGWTTERVANAWTTLMRRLGYDRFVAQGGDWGAFVTMNLAGLAPPELKAIHLNLATGGPDASERERLTDDERARVAALERHRTEGRGYSEQQSTHPQTLGYALADSAMGQAAWIYEKYREWSDCGDDPSSVFTFDEMLDNIMLYWLPNAAASSARLYWESFRKFTTLVPNVPTGVSLFPKEISRPTRAWAERRLPRIVYWNELSRGGHFAAFEVPDLFVSEMRTYFRAFR